MFLRRVCIADAATLSSQQTPNGNNRDKLVPKKQNKILFLLLNAWSGLKVYSGNYKEQIESMYSDVNAMLNGLHKDRQTR